MADEVPGEKPTTPAGETPAGAAPEPEKTPTAAELKAQLDAVQKALKDANREAAERRKKLDAYEKADADRQAAALSETEKLQKANAEMAKRLERIEAERQQEAIKYAVTSKAAALGFTDPSDAYALLDLAAVTVQDDGTLKGVDEALTAMAKAKPYMLGKRGAPALNTGNPGAANQPHETDDEKRARLLGARLNPFSDDFLQAKGGGVIWNTKE